MKKDKELTKQKLIDAVGTVIAQGGYSSLGINKIAKAAGVDKKLIYRYFNSVDSLIEAYVVRKDSWFRLASSSDELLPRREEKLSDYAGRLMCAQFDYFYDDKEMQQIIHWEITEPNELLDSLAKAKEIMGGQIFERVDQEFKSPEIDIRSLSALVLGGIYNIVLHSRVNKSTFCELDIKTQKDRQRLKTTIAQLYSWALSKNSSSNREQTM